MSRPPPPPANSMYSGGSGSARGRGASPNPPASSVSRAWPLSLQPNVAPSLTPGGIIPIGLRTFPALLQQERQIQQEKLQLQQQQALIEAQKAQLAAAAAALKNEQAKLQELKQASSSQKEPSPPRGGQSSSKKSGRAAPAQSSSSRAPSGASRDGERARGAPEPPRPPEPPQDDRGRLHRSSGSSKRGAPDEDWHRDMRRRKSEKDEGFRRGDEAYRYKEDRYRDNGRDDYSRRERDGRYGRRPSPPRSSRDGYDRKEARRDSPRRRELSPRREGGNGGNFTREEGAEAEVRSVLDAKSGRNYYVLPDGTTSWYKAIISSTGRPYFVLPDGTTSWTDPDKQPPQPQSQPQPQPQPVARAPSPQPPPPLAVASQPTQYGGVSNEYVANNAPKQPEEEWFTAYDPNGRPYYYNERGDTHWTKPTKGAI